jgi:hypothetical protein
MLMDVRFVAHYGLNSRVRAKFGPMHRNKAAPFDHLFGADEGIAIR